MQRHREEHLKAVADKKKKDEYEMINGDEAEQKETKLKQKKAREMAKLKEDIKGNFSDGHKPRKVRSFKQ